MEVLVGRLRPLHRWKTLVGSAWDGFKDIAGDRAYELSPGMWFHFEHPTVAVNRSPPHKRTFTSISIFYWLVEFLMHRSAPPLGIWYPN